MFFLYPKKEKISKGDDYMSEQTLTKVYYKTPDLYEKTYESRYNAPFSFHLGFMIHQYNHQKAYPAFFYYNQDYALYAEKIYKTYEKFQKIVHKVPPIVLHQFALLSIIDEVKSTNDIEGVHSTRKEIRDILDGKLGKSDRLKSIVNKYKGLLDDTELSFKTCKDIRNFYDEFAHEEIAFKNKEHLLDGRLFRKDSVDIESAQGKIIHQGLFPESRIIETMKQALNILNSTEHPLLVRLSLFHYIFAYIHPFYDGNGRTDRFVTSYFLKQDFHVLLALRLSIYIKRNRKKYYNLFAEADSEINRGDLTPFLIGFLQIIFGTMEDTIQLLTRKDEQLKRYTEKIKFFYGKDELLNELYYILLQATLFYGRGVTITQLIEITKKTRSTIQKRIDLMPKNHLVVEKNGKSFYYKLDLMILR